MMSDKLPADLHALQLLVNTLVMLLDPGVIYTVSREDNPHMPEPCYVITNTRTGSTMPVGTLNDAIAMASLTIARVQERQAVQS